MPAQAPCPKCRGAFIEIDRGGIKIDVCQECRSVFLDRGELDQIIAAEQRAVSNVYAEDESFFRQLAGQRPRRRPRLRRSRCRSHSSRRRPSSPRSRPTRRRPSSPRSRPTRRRPSSTAAAAADVQRPAAASAAAAVRPEPRPARPRRLPSAVRLRRQDGGAAARRLPLTPVLAQEEAPEEPPAAALRLRACRRIPIRLPRHIRGASSHPRCSRGRATHRERVRLEALAAAPRQAHRPFIDRPSSSA